MGFEAGVYTVFRGYIDDSGNEKIFTLGCIMAKGETWQWITMDWKAVLDAKNTSLTKQGRKQLPRFHAVDLNNFREEYSDWNPDERKEFSKDLLHVFQKPSNRVNGYAYSIELDALAEIIPRTKSDPKGFAYSLLLKLLMIDIGRKFTESNEGDLSEIRVALIHDRCGYNGVLQEAFDSYRRDETAAFGGIFSTLAPMGWEDCVPLQPADFIAYENYKEVLRRVSDNEKDRKRDRRIPLKELLNSDSFGGFCKSLGEGAIAELNRLMDESVSRAIEAKKESDGAICHDQNAKGNAPQ